MRKNVELNHLLTLRANIESKYNINTEDKNDHKIQLLLHYHLDHFYCDYIKNKMMYLKVMLQYNKSDEYTYDAICSHSNRIAPQKLNSACNIITTKSFHV